MGAYKPGEAGAHFAWGENTAGKTKDGETYYYETYHYYWDNYKWTDDGGDTFTKYTTSTKTTLDAEDDAAAVNRGGKWQMPTMAQLIELSDNCTREWKREGEYAAGSLAGYLLTSKENGNTLFLPAAGLCWESDLYDQGSYGYYWSAELFSGYSSSARFLRFYSGYWSTDCGYDRCGVFSVRPVCPSAE